MSLIRKHVAVLQAWACLALVSVISRFILQELYMCTRLMIFQVFYKREGGEVDFYRGWHYYKEGFGSLGEEFWLG